MGKFIRNILGFILICIICSGVILLFGGNGKDNANNAFAAIESIYKSSGYKILVLGDSVCAQILNPCQKQAPDVLMAGNNMSAGVCGQYLLMMNFLDNNPEAETVYYFVRPYSFRAEQASEWMYKYYILPLFTENNKKYLSEEEIRYTEEAFGAIFVNNKYVKKVLQRSPYLREIYYRKMNFKSFDMSQHTCTDESLKYLGMMNEVCRQRGVEFRVVPAPLADIEENYRWEQMQMQINDNNLGEAMGDFINRIQYYDSSNFYDGVHFDESFLNKNRFQIIDNCIPEILQYLSVD